MEVKFNTINNKQCLTNGIKCLIMLQGFRANSNYNVARYYYSEVQFFTETIKQVTKDRTQGLCIFDGVSKELR